jgi:hypothetical protein
MTRKLILIGIGLVAFCVGLGVSRVLSPRLEFESNVTIPAIQLHTQKSCFEAETSPDLSTFFDELRDALKKEDTHRLFTMTRRCNFDWYADAALSHPLLYEEVSVPSQLETPFEVKPILKVPWGQRLVFESENDFALNIRVIFSPGIMRRLLRDDPQASTECEYAVSWRERVLNHLCFERDSSGFKFIGLRTEP